MLTTYPAETAAAFLVLAHGAGAGQKSPFMVQVARGMAARGVTTATFDFPYMTARRKIPDRAPVLEDAWRQAIDEARSQLAGLPLFIGGKSMGGRIASHIGAQGYPGIAGLIFLGYPLHPPGKPEQRRDAHLPSVAAPMLFVQGSRDPFGTSAEIAALMPSLQHAMLHEVAGGDHSFKVPGRKDTVDAIMDAVAGWIRR
ncbi:MAG TPA: alpha/beta family hydrolase [Vicinamibacterales bacterium]|nr:alpha/beta family hydrolase [Vicinamibacterales bacterium]